MQCANGTGPMGFNCLVLGVKASRRVSRPRLGWFGLLLAGAMTASVPVLAQQKTGPGLTGDDSLTWHGVTLYGVVDIGLQFDTHSAPFTPYRPSASGNIVRQNDYQSATGLTPSNMGQSRVGLQGNEPLNDEWSAVFQVESFFNPQSGEIANALKSLAVNNGRSLTTQSIGVDGSSAGQALQTAFAGFSSARFGTFTVGRQQALLAEGSIKYDPNYGASAFGLIGASNTYSGGGSSENNRLDSTAKYFVNFNDLVHFAALYKFNGSNGAANTAVQADVGGQYAGLSVDAYYSKVNSAITASALTAAQVKQLPTLGYSVSNALAGTISDNTTYSLMALYNFDPLKFFAGYMNIKYANPKNPLSAGFSDIGGYILAFVTNQCLQQYENRSGVLDRRSLHRPPRSRPDGGFTTAIIRMPTAPERRPVARHPRTALAAAASSPSPSTPTTDSPSHFDAYLGAMYSAVHDGAASGYLFSTNINPRSASATSSNMAPSCQLARGFSREGNRAGDDVSARRGRHRTGVIYFTVLGMGVIYFTVLVRTPSREGLAYRRCLRDTS